MFYFSTTASSSLGFLQRFLSLIRIRIEKAAGFGSALKKKKKKKLDPDPQKMNAKSPKREFKKKSLLPA